MRRDADAMVAGGRLVRVPEYWFLPRAAERGSASSAGALVGVTQEERPSYEGRPDGDSAAERSAAQCQGVSRGRDVDLRAGGLASGRQCDEPLLVAVPRRACAAPRKGRLEHAGPQLQERSCLAAAEVRRAAVGQSKG